MSSSIPPNNLDSLLGWIRVFAQDVSIKIQTLKKGLAEVKKELSEKEDKK
jgi:hypothetical protein